MKAAIVVTSINDCTELLNGYLANFAKYGREATIYLIPDLKTPRFTIPKSVGIVSESQQLHFLNYVKFPSQEIPWNSDNRRNVGYLMALDSGAEMIVSIDDDNYCQEHFDYIGQHLNGLSDTISNRNNGPWFNNLSLIDQTPHRAYPRGFPFFARQNHWQGSCHTERATVRINAGMWIGDPDLDAMAWLHDGFRGENCSGSVVLHSKVWCPINSQNTAVHRDLMPAYYFIRMVPPSDRFGDIFQGYFALKVAKHMGWTVRFGSPVVTHRRNSHVYLKDVQKEIEPILMLEELLPKLIEHKLTGTTVTEAYLSLADFIEGQGTQFYSDTARLMRQWAATCRRING